MRPLQWVMDVLPVAHKRKHRHAAHPDTRKAVSDVEKKAEPSQRLSRVSASSHGLGKKG